jgi:hypothetical protein
VQIYRYIIVIVIIIIIIIIIMYVLLFDITCYNFSCVYVCGYLFHAFSLITPVLSLYLVFWLLCQHIIINKLLLLLLLLLLYSVCVKLVGYNPATDTIAILVIGDSQTLFHTKDFILTSSNAPLATTIKLKYKGNIRIHAMLLLYVLQKD